MTCSPGKSRSLLGVLAALAALSALAASPPEVVRVRVPSSRVSAYFPPKGSLRTLSVDQFEALVSGAEAGARSRTGATDPTTPRHPVRVEHFARWEDGALVGRSKVTLPATSLDPAIVVCEPWSPALVDSEDRSGFVRVDRGGRLSLIQPANQPTRAVELHWRQSAQPDSEGRAFALRLPDAGVAGLALDLPSDLVPTALGSRQAPEPTPTADQTRWEFAGASGWFPIQFRSKTPGGVTANRLWVGGSTRIDLNSTAENWVAQWRVESTAEAPTTCLIDLDDGLELVDVSGAEVEGYRMTEGSGRPGKSSRVEVALCDPGANTSKGIPLTLRGRVQPPLEGNWPIPSARPVDAGWLGGRTEVRLDPGRVVTGCVERSGRRVAAQPDESPAPSTWVFESNGRPGPLAELRLDRSRVDASVEVAGTLRVGPFAPRVEVVATWTVGCGRLFEPSLDFPQGWVVDRVVGLDGRPNGTWHSEANPGMTTQRIHFDGRTASGDSSGRTIALVVSATRIEPSPATLVLPRVRPPAGTVRVADERWVAATEPGWEIEPKSSRGVAWSDPSAMAPASGDGATSEPEASGQKLAWRWVAEDGEATVIGKRDPSRAEVDERLEAVVAGGRLRLVWFWTVPDAARPDSLAFHLDLDPKVAPRWRLVDRSGGVVLEPRRLAPDRRTASNFPATGIAAELPLVHLPPGPLTIRGETEVAWSSSGAIPLLRFPESVAARRSVVVRVEDDTRFRLDRVEGLDPVGRGGGLATDPESSPFRAIVGDDEAGLRVAGAWVGDGGPGPGRLEISTVANLGPGDGGAVVTEASLVSRVSPGSDSRHRLILRVAPGLARTLDLRMPGGATLDRIRRDGQPAVVSEQGASLQVNLALSDPSRPTSTITLDYRTGHDLAQVGRIAPSSLLPTLTLPCLSFSWQVNTPERFAVSSESANLVSTDLVDPGATDRPWSTRSEGGEPGGDAEEALKAAMRVDLDQVLKAASPLETTLGDWLVKLDAGRWPLVVDRLVLQGVGWGPKSRINVVDFDPRRPMTAPAVFHSLGLSVEPVGATFLISTEASRAGDFGRASVQDRTSLGQILFDAAIVGADRTDRYQSPSRWRGEPTPRAWLAIETPDRGLIANGWRSHRFVASGRPDASMAISVVDPWARSRQVGLVASGLAALLAFFGASRLAGRRGALGLAVFLSATWSASARFSPDEPIIAVMPYDDLAQVEAKPDRVVIRQEDHDRLVQLAQPSRPPASRGWLISATHHVARPVGRSVLVESRYALEVVGSTAESWAFPVGPAFDLTATVDGRPSPLIIGPDGRTASVGSIPPGRSSVVFRRSVPWGNAGRVGSGGSIRVPVDASAFARVEVDRGDGSEGIELAGLAGSVEARADGLVGELGPRDAIDIRWGPKRASAASRPEVAGVIRWDAQPSGDRLSARLTVAGKTPLGAIRLGLEPGTSVIGQTIPGLVGTSVAGSADRPEWVARVDPPLGPGASCEVTFWRPAASTSTASTRTIPRLELVGGRLAGLVGFRKPDGWSGRLSDPSSVDLFSELNFVRRWGPMAADGLSMAGASRFDGPLTIEVQVGPEPVRRTFVDQVGVEVVAGGLKFTVDSVLKDRPGLSWEAEAAFDGAVRISRAEATGLAFWEQREPNRVRLVFEGSKLARERTIHLEGFVAGSETSGDLEGGLAALAVAPWPRWAAADQESGRLVVSGGEGFQVVSGETRLAEDSSGSSPPSATGRTRKTYSGRRVEPGSRVEWTTPPARVNVSIRSNLQLEPTRVAWTADVVSEVSGGAVRTLTWKLPTAWALGATLTGAGKGQPFEVETRGDSTFWTIPLDPPTWNRRKLTIRSVRPRVPGVNLNYPEVAPLSAPGRGRVVRYDLAVTNLSGLPPARGSLTGITPLASASDRSIPSPVPGGAVSRAFRVTGQPWSLQLLGDSTGPTGASEPPLRVGQFDVERQSAHLDGVNLQVAVGSTVVQGQAEVRSRPGPAFLPVFLASGTRLAGASVEGRPTVPIEAGSGGRWLIPLGDRDARRVVFGWLQPISGAISATLPTFDQPNVPTSVQVSSTVDVSDWTIAGGTWERLSPIAASLARFERIGDEILEATERINREPTASRSVAILDQLVDMALDLRAARRSLQVADAIPSLRIEPWREIQDRVDAKILEAGLGPLLEEAKERVGLAPPGPESGRNVGFEEIPDVYRIRPIGRSFHFQGTTAEDPTQASSLVAIPRSP